MGIEISSLQGWAIGVIVIGVVMLLILRTDDEISRRAKLLGTAFFALLWPIALVVVILLIIKIFVSGIIKGFRDAEEAREEKEHGDG